MTHAPFLTPAQSALSAELPTAEGPTTSRSPVAVEGVPISHTPTGVPARDLPLGMVGDVRDVLSAHGLEVDVLELMQGLRVLVERTPWENGGRLR